MKICIITSSYPMNINDNKEAAGLFARDFALKLSQKGNEVYVITPERNGVSKDDKQIKVIRFPSPTMSQNLSSLRIYNPLDLIKIIKFILQGRKKVIEFLKKEKIDFMLALWALPSGLWAYWGLKKYGIKYGVWCLGSDIWIYGRSIYTKWVIRIILKKALLRYADGVELTKEVSKICNKKTDFLPTSRSLPPPRNFDYAFNKNKKIYCFIGRYHKTKGPDILIDSIALLGALYNDKIDFHFFGGGDLKDEMSNKVADLQLQNVYINDFIGPEHLSFVIEKSDFIIIPSRYDSIPVVLSETLQLGTPVIVSNVGDMSDIVKKYDIGFYFQKGNIKELSETIIKSLDYKKKDFTNNILEAHKIFDIEEAVMKLCNDINIE